MNRITEYENIHCICCGIETNPDNTDEYTHWFQYLCYGKKETRRRSDPSFFYSHIFLCCFPLFSSTYYYEKDSTGYEESLYCCLPPCCIDCIETSSSCRCDCTIPCCNTRTCFSHEFLPEREADHTMMMQEKSEENAL